MRMAAVLLVGALGALASGCGAGRAAKQDGPIATRGVACSFALSYSSLAQLRRHASSVAVIEPTGAVRRRRQRGCQ